ncbi:hypothetical protein ACFL5X_00555 [Candidatus Omnitrophota bacterium]
MHDWHKHILTIGLEELEEYRGLPIIGNPRALRKGFSILRLWPLLTLFFGLFYCKTGIYRYADDKGKHVGVYSKIRYRCSLALVFLSLLFLINNWPFFRPAFDQYQGGLGSLPYQGYIDYVNENGGLTFWAHPEAEYILTTDYLSSISFETRKHLQTLISTEDYTGFSIFPEGYREVGRPGGIWDRLLKEYCSGKRERPIWAIGGLAFEKGNLSERMKCLQTIVLAPEKEERAVVDALKKGKMYVVQGMSSSDFTLSDFFISDEAGESKGFAGDVVKIEGSPFLHIEASFQEEQREVEVKVIKDGVIVKVAKIETPFLISYCDNSPLLKKSYYRLEIKGKAIHVITNPIFVE